MADESVLSDDLLRQLINVGEVDILVGLPTHNNAKTVGPVVQAIQSGLLSNFSRERSAIINVDGGSRDGTPELVTGASISDVRHIANLRALRTLHSFSTQYASSPDSGLALRTILAAADLLRAKACAVISPESAGAQPDWMEKLLRPLYTDRADFVTPIYRRHKFEGLLLSNLLYPMTRAIYGKSVREPYASDFGFTGNMAGQFLRQEVWHQEVGRTGAEMVLSLSAIAGGCRLHQVFLGNKPQAEQGARDLVPVMRQTVGTLFWSLEGNFPSWSSVTGAQPVSTDGPEHETALDPVRINRKRLFEMFRAGVTALTPVFGSILSSSTLTELQQIAGMEEEDFRYPAGLWVKTVYEFAAAYHKSPINRDHIIQALPPLYRGRAFTFLVENRDASADEVEANVEALCKQFEDLKPYLLEVWNSEK